MNPKASHIFTYGQQTGETEVDAVHVGPSLPRAEEEHAEDHVKDEDEQTRCYGNGHQPDVFDQFELYGLTAFGLFRTAGLRVAIFLEKRDRVTRLCTNSTRSGCKKINLVTLTLNIDEIPLFDDEESELEVSDLFPFPPVNIEVGL